jgi:lauroyl/myristoyl acyltransferase
MTEQRSIAQKYVEDLSASPETARESMYRLGAADLYDDDLHYAYLNLLSVLGEKGGGDSVLQTAVLCIKQQLFRGWEYCAFLRTLPTLARLSENAQRQTLCKFSDLDFSVPSELLRREAGLIICAFHLGPYRFLGTDLAFRGLPVTVPVDDAAFEQNGGLVEFSKAQLRTRLRRTSLPIHNIFRFCFVRAESHQSTQHMIATLAANGVVLIYVDGNTGVGGPLSDLGKVTISFCGHQSRVKRGAAKLALNQGAPILPAITTFNKDGRPCVEWARPIFPKSRLQPADREGFYTATMQQIYEHLEHSALSHPEQWESCRFLHRWKVLPSMPNSVHESSLNSTSNDVRFLLNTGWTFKVNGQRVARLPTKAGYMWVDVQRMRVYKFDSRSAELIRTLSESEGLGLSWLRREGYGESNSDPVLRLLAEYQNLGLVSPVQMHSGAGPADAVHRETGIQVERGKNEGR